MGKMQRTRGSVYEREVCDVLSKKFGTKISRVLGQARDGGLDIEAGPFAIECKRRRTIAVYQWLDQLEKAAKDGDRLPIVVARADGRRSIAILYLDDCLAMVPDDPEENTLAGRQLEVSKKQAVAGSETRRSRADEVVRLVEHLRKKSWSIALAIVGDGDDGGTVCQGQVGAQAAAMGGSGSGGAGKDAATLGEADRATVSD